MILVFYLLALAWGRTGLPGPLEWVLPHPWLRPTPTGPGSSRGAASMVRGTTAASPRRGEPSG